MTFESPTFWEASLRAQDFQKHLNAEHPPCAACGMPLAPVQDKDDLICNYCGLRHHFLKPPEPTEVTEFRIGDNVAVEWKGNWWFAHIVDEVIADEADTTNDHDVQRKWLVHFIGWAPAFDAEVDQSRIRAIDYFPGDTIIRPASGKAPEQTTGEVRDASPTAIIVMVLLAALGFAVLFLFPQTLNVPGSNLQPDTSGIITGPVSQQLVNADTPVTVGQRFHVKWGDNWYMGTATYLNSFTNDITVRYTRWGSEYEEIVPRERLRLVK